MHMITIADLHAYQSKYCLLNLGYCIYAVSECDAPYTSSIYVSQSCCCLQMYYVVRSTKCLGTLSRKWGVENRLLHCCQHTPPGSIEEVYQGCDHA